MIPLMQHLGIWHSFALPLWMLADISSYGLVLPTGVSFGQDSSAPRLIPSQCIYIVHAMIDVWVTLTICLLSVIFKSGIMASENPYRYGTDTLPEFVFKNYCLTPKQITRLLMDLEPCTSSSRSITHCAVCTILFTSALSHTSSICQIGDLVLLNKP